MVMARCAGQRNNRDMLMRKEVTSSLSSQVYTHHGTLEHGWM